MKKILIIGAIVIVILSALLFLIKPKTENTVQEQERQRRIKLVEEFKRNGGSIPVTQDSARVANPDTATSPDTEQQAPISVGKLKVVNFSGKLEEVNTGCFADGECYVVVDGKHITTLMGWSQNEVGSVQGVEGFGDLESHIGAEIEVYAQDSGDGTYTLYGSEGFYVKLK